MVESIIRRYKLYRKGYEYEDLHADALSFLMMKANKFDTTAGKKAYSYYGTIIKHYLLGLVQSILMGRQGYTTIGIVIMIQKQADTSHLTRLDYQEQAISLLMLIAIL